MIVVGYTCDNTMHGDCRQLVVTHFRQLRTNYHKVTLVKLVRIECPGVVVLVLLSQ